MIDIIIMIFTFVNLHVHHPHHHIQHRLHKYHQLPNTSVVLIRYLDQFVGHLVNLHVHQHVGQSPPLTSFPRVSSIARVSSVKSSEVIFTHQGHINQVGSLVLLTYLLTLVL